MKKIFITIALLMSVLLPANATKLPDNVQNFITATYPKSVFRFDGVVILPDNTVYLPLIPSKFNTETVADIKYTIPENKTLEQKPNAIVLTNDYVLLKLIKNNKGKNTILSMPAPPVELVTGVFPQDMLVPKNFIIPESMRNIIGNLDIRTFQENGLVIPVTPPKKMITNSLDRVPILKNKIMYIVSSISKNIQVVNPAKGYPSYALSQTDIPIMVKGYDVFLLVTSYGKKSLDVISLTDDKVIKEIGFNTQPEEIVIDANNKLAYVSSGEDASIYVVNLETMTLKRQLRLNGMCEKIALSDDGTKLFYSDKQTREVWVLDLENNYTLKAIGKFPNVSKIIYMNDKIYIISRTKSRLAIIDYETIGLMSENFTSDKPVDMLAYNDNLYILAAGGKTIDVIDTTLDQRTNMIELTNSEFPSKLIRIDDTNLAIVADARAQSYSIIDLDKKAVVQTNALDIPITSMYITNSFKKIGSK